MGKMDGIGMRESKHMGMHDGCLGECKGHMGEKVIYDHVSRLKFRQIRARPTASNHIKKELIWLTFIVGDASILTILGTVLGRADDFPVQNRL
jgi:hypothetical protein